MADGEDAFDEVSDDNIGDRDYRTLKTARFKDGFREGVSGGENKSAQQGFDTGYEIAFAAVREVAGLKGVITVILHKIKDDKAEDSAKKIEVIAALTDALVKLDVLVQNIKQDLKLQCDSYYKQSDAFRIASLQQGHDSEKDNSKYCATSSTQLKEQDQKLQDTEILKQHLITVLTNYGWELSLINRLIKGD